MRRLIWTLAACVLVTGCGIESRRAKQIEERDKQIADLKREGMQLVNRKSDLQAARQKNAGKESPSEAADWKAKLRSLDAELQGNVAALKQAEKDRAEELSQ